MKFRKINDNRLNEWILNKWYEKTLFVVGTLIVVIWIISFIAGFIVAIIN